MISLIDVCLFSLLVLAVVYWWRGRERHSTALRSAKQYCQTRGIQLLDETLVFQKFAFAKTQDGNKFLSRIYTFDFCQDGIDRQKGEIILRGSSVVRVVLETEELEITEY